VQTDFWQTFHDFYYFIFYNKMTSYIQYPEN
jgi:hypothetical protein